MFAKKILNVQQMNNYIFSCGLFILKVTFTETFPVLGPGWWKDAPDPVLPHLADKGCWPCRAIVLAEMPSTMMNRMVKADTFVLFLILG